MRNRKTIILIFVLIAGSFLLGNCSINKMIVNKVADQLASGEGSTVFTGDDDPQLIKDALPFALKLYESLLQSVPENRELLLSTGQAYCMYAYAFIQMEAEMLLDEEIDKKTEMLKRAKKLYLRGRGYLLRAMEVEYPGFTNAVFKDQADSLLARMEKEDVSYLYWCGMSWMGAFSTDPFDMELSFGRPMAVKLISRAYALDGSYDRGAIDAFFISYYGSMPPDLGGSEEKARIHYAKALELSGGQIASPYVSLASSVSVKNQNAEEFKELMQKALEIDVDKDPSSRLLNILSQKQAKWMLEHMDNYFLLEKGESEE